MSSTTAISTTTTATQQPQTPDTKSLDTLRRSLHTLTSTLQALHRDLSAPNPSTGATAAAPLPSWASLQNSFNLLTHHLNALAAHVDASRGLLTAAHAYPLPSFPREHEALLAQLLRRKVDVGVEGWLERAVGAADEVVVGGGGPQQDDKDGDNNRDGEGDDRKKVGGLSAEELAELWEWALPCAGDAAQKVPLGIDVTMEERGAEGGVEAVRRREGLRRVLRGRSVAEEEEDEDEDEDDEDEDEDGASRMDVDAPATATAGNTDAEKVQAAAKKPPEIPMVPLEDVVKFMITGASPPDGAR